ncbi:uncharacterized protein LOC126821789 isoform X1 [Patella vulgata]|uniref:uncharacterized protein LOC126821789 isoform X1 n=1 Tax=Patella vulgata TaxID=6465 RepID=UPI0021805F3E|nr:uncharacterized protein LOC126821789 isoform X1 [Patella vulgata]
MGEHRKLVLIILIILTTIIFAGLQFTTFLAANPTKSYGIFFRGIGNVSDTHHLDLTPASPTFSIWAIIYGWQIIMLIYCLTSTCRHTPDGPVCTSPVLLPPMFFITYIANNISSITWLFLWDRLYFISSTVFLFLIAITLYVCMVISYRALNRHYSLLVARERKAEIWLIILLVQNGIAIYATWTSIASLLNLATVLAYDIPDPVEQEVASVISLGILAVELLLFVGTDLTIFDKYSRYVFTPYLVLVVGLSGVIAKDWNPETPTCIFAAVLLAMSIISAICKCIRLSQVFFKRNDQDDIVLKE